MSLQAAAAGLCDFAADSVGLLLDWVLLYSETAGGMTMRSRWFCSAALSPLGEVSLLPKTMFGECSGALLRRWRECMPALLYSTNFRAEPISCCIVNWSRSGTPSTVLPLERGKYIQSNLLSCMVIAYNSFHSVSKHQHIHNRLHRLSHPSLSRRMRICPSRHHQCHCSLAGFLSNSGIQVRVHEGRKHCCGAGFQP